METIAELYGIIVKEFLKKSLEYENIAKSNASLYILTAGFNIITNVFKSQSIYALESIYKTCKEATLMYFEYIDQLILLNKFNMAETINANIFIFNKLIKKDADSKKTNAARDDIRCSISNMSRLCGVLFDWKNADYTIEDRNSIAAMVLSGYVELFSELHNSELIISSLELLREKYGALDLHKFQIYLKELYYVLKNHHFTKDRFELYSIICDESTERKYRDLALSEDKKEFRKFFCTFFYSAFR